MVWDRCSSLDFSCPARHPQRVKKHSSITRCQSLFISKTLSGLCLSVHPLGDSGITAVKDDSALGSRNVTTLMPEPQYLSRYISRFQNECRSVANGPRRFVEQQASGRIVWWCCQFSATKVFPLSFRDCGKIRDSLKGPHDHDGDNLAHRRPSNPFRKLLRIIRARSDTTEKMDGWNVSRIQL